MVKTRHSLPRQRHSSTATTTPEAVGASTTTSSTPEPTLADLDSREAARLATNARFGEVEKEEEKPKELGTYHWRGAVYAIEENTPRKWIEQGEAEWAKTLKNRERVKREREEGVRMREEAVLKRRREEEVKEEEMRRKKRKVDTIEKEKTVVEEEKSSVVREMAAVREKGRRRSENTSAERRMMNTITTLPARTRPSSSTSISRKRPQASTSSTASSNIEVAHTRTSSSSKQKQKKGSRPPPSHPQNDISDDSLSEPDSAGDLPTIRGVANVLAGRNTLPHIAVKKSQSKKKGQCTSPIPQKATRKDVVENITVNLVALGKTNDRVEQLKKWWDGEKNDGAFQRMIEIVKRNRQGQASQAEVREGIREFSETAGDDVNVQLLLRDMAVEEEERRKSVEEDGPAGENGMMEGIPTPESQDPITLPAITSTQQPTVLAIQPTPPASDHDDHHHSASFLGAATAPINNNKSPQVLISPPPAATKTLNLPTHDRGGNPLRWSIDPAKLNSIKLKEKEMRDPERAEFAIHKRRLEGESKAQRRRRVRRELREVDGWTIIADPNLLPSHSLEAAKGEGEDDDGMEDVVYEHQEDEDVVEQEVAATSSPEPIGVEHADEEVEQVAMVDWEAQGGKAVEKVLKEGGRVGRGKSRRRVRSHQGKGVRAR